MPDRRRSRIIGLLIPAMFLIVFATAHRDLSAAEEKVNTGYFGGIAIMGYDPVAYFTQSDRDCQ